MTDFKATIMYGLYSKHVSDVMACGEVAYVVWFMAQNIATDVRSPSPAISYASLFRVFLQCCEVAQLHQDSSEGCCGLPC